MALGTSKGFCRIVNGNIPSFAKSIEEIKQRAQLQSVVDVYEKVAVIQLLSFSGNRIGSAYVRKSHYWCSIYSLAVSVPNLNQGYGRLLLIETAFWAYTQGIRWILPGSSITDTARQAFIGYPMTAEKILQHKIPRSLESIKPPQDVPWQNPPVSFTRDFKTY